MRSYRPGDHIRTLAFWDGRLDTRFWERECGHTLLAWVNVTRSFGNDLSDTLIWNRAFGHDLLAWVNVHDAFGIPECTRRFWVR